MLIDSLAGSLPAHAWPTIAVAGAVVVAIMLMRYLDYDKKVRYTYLVDERTELIRHARLTSPLLAPVSASQNGWPLYATCGLHASLSTRATQRQDISPAIYQFTRTHKVT